MRRRALSLVELMVVLSIIGVVLALLLPAVHSARERARETVCKNNIHQMNLAIADYAGVYKKLPPANPPHLVGGWCIEILPFMEQKNLRDQISVGSLISAADEFLLHSPRLMRCPTRSSIVGEMDGQMQISHYVFVPLSRRESFMLIESDLKSSAAWASGPELPRTAAIQAVGPHNRGVFFSQGYQQGIGLMINGMAVD
jgi:prepilin-type N-terminal cleavage/methylation domain-containing protein